MIFPLRTAILGLGALALAACTPASEERQFAAYQDLMLSTGKMRGDTTPSDAPYDNRTLAENFRRIAFFESAPDHTARQKTLTRWTGPLRYAIDGADVSRTDRQIIGQIMWRVSRLTGLPVSADQTRPNFVIYIHRRDETARVLPSISDGQLQQSDIDQLADFALDCSVRAFIGGHRESEISTVFVFVRAAVKGYYRQACLHEEIFQGLGLFHDDDSVRPSIFNDDEEFALLTEHDSYLIRTLYDPALSAGMTMDEAMPLVPAIIGRLRGL